jgi:hypothetical protein
MPSIRLRIPILVLALSLCTIPARANTDQSIPKKSVLTNMAAFLEFSDTAVTDDPVPQEAKILNPGYKISVFYRTSEDPHKPTPAEGGIVAKVFMKGVPEERGFPDGNYYLWIGGPDESMRAVLLKTDGSVEREVEVLSKPSLAEEEVPHSPRVHVLVGPPTEKQVLLEQLLPHPPPPPRPPLPPKPTPLPPKPPPPPPPPRSWREICVHPPSDHGGKRWIRVPDN